MKKWIRECLFRHFNGQTTVIDAEIKQALRRSKRLTCDIVKHYFSGGSYKAAQSTFFIAESTYYWRIQKFVKLLSDIVNLSAAPLLY